MPSTPKAESSSDATAGKPQITIAEAREKLIAYMTDRWTEQLVTLGASLKAQGFSDEEILEIGDSYEPMFRKNLAAAILQFDREADAAIAHFKAAEAIKTAKKPEADA